MLWVDSSIERPLSAASLYGNYWPKADALCMARDFRTRSSTLSNRGVTDWCHHHTGLPLQSSELATPKTRPGRAPVERPSRHATSPFTITVPMPRAARIGLSNVAVSPMAC
ncbi:MAG: hypothetical protein ABIP49_06090, partial [Lysobacterales bacterium]